MYYAVDAFFWYKAVFTLELLIAEGLVVFRLPRRKNFVLRLILSILACFVVAFALPCTGIPLLATLLFFAMFVVSLFAIFITFKVDWRTLLFCGIVAYTMQHMSNQTFDLFLFATGVAGGGDLSTPSVGSGVMTWLPALTYGSGQGSVSSNIFVFMFYVGFYAIIYFLVYKLFKKYGEEKGGLLIKSTSLMLIVLIILLFDILLSAVVMQYAQGNMDRGYIIMLDFYNIFCCIFTLYLQFNVILVNRLEQDLAIVNNLWQQQKKQYDLTKENIDMINIKCHDLKHQIRKIGSKDALPQESIKEIESLISIYDSSVKTGNEALDVILTEKRLQCYHDKITLSCIADGKALAFISETDIYSLFGNLLDNAIEAVRRLSEEKRTIGVSVKRTGNSVFLNVRNSYEGKIIFRDKLPVTTKKDKINHGYGMKSVQMLVQRYEGEISIKAENGTFSVSALFPDKNPS